MDRSKKHHISRATEQFVRAANDYYETCPHCKTKSLIKSHTITDEVSQKLLDIKPREQHIICKNCNREMTHLEMRTYGQQFPNRAIMPPMDFGLKEFQQRPEPFKDGYPLWAIGDGEKE